MVTIAGGLLLTATGCGGGDDDTSRHNTSSSAPAEQDDNDGRHEPREPQPGTVLAEVEGQNGLTLAITSAIRDGGGFVTVEGTVTNNTGAVWVAADWRSEETELAKNGGSVSGAGLIDQRGKKKYLVLRDTAGRCLCTRFTGGGVRDGATSQWFAQFPAPPEGTDKVDFQVGSMPPASIDLSEGE
jgi:hypothetical protein